MDLSIVPVSQAAAALVDRVVLQCLLVDASRRKTKRGPDGIAKLRGAVAVVLGGLLRYWLRERRWVFQSHDSRVFAGEGVAYRQYVAAEAALNAAAWIEVFPGISFEQQFGAVGRRAARLMPQAALLELAAALGITEETARTDFVVSILAHPPKLITEAIQLRPLKARYGRTEAPLVTGGFAPPAAAVLTSDVQEMNNAAEKCSFSGCRPPRWYRVFSGSPALGGRWQVPGGGGNYLIMPRADRGAILMNGAATVTLDIKAAHLSILLGLTGQSMPDGDPYAVGAGLPRAVVKHWVMLALGSGRMRTRWPKGTKGDISAFSAAAVGAAVAARFPVFRQLAGADVVRALGLNRLSDLGKPQSLLALRLQNIEAQALTLALRALVGTGILALPIHDAVIVQADHEATARTAIEQACLRTFGVVPAITREAASGDAEPP